MSGTREAWPEGLTQLGVSLGYGAFLRFERYPGLPSTTDLEPKLQAVIGALSVRHHFGNGFAAGLSVPFGTVRLEPGGEQSSVRRSGLGDMEVEGRGDLAALWGPRGYAPSLTVGLGLGLPTGAVNEIGEHTPGVVPNQIALGSGAFSGIGRLELTQFVHQAVALEAELSLRKAFGTSPAGLELGNQLGAAAGVVWLAPSGFTVGARAVLEHRGMTWEQSKGEVLNSGGTWLFGELSGVLGIAERVSLVLGARLPLVAVINGSQTLESFSGRIALVLSLGGDAHAHAHAHEDEDGDGDGDESSAQPLPDLARGGASFVEADAIVPGKVTVIDFWAEWCHPCKHIDATLRGLVAEDPDVLVVRRVEVPDFDTPVALEHLPDAPGLPVVWIYDRHGKKRVLQGPSPDQVVEAVNAALLAP